MSSSLVASGPNLGAVELKLPEQEDLAVVSGAENRESERWVNPAMMLGRRIKNEQKFFMTKEDGTKQPTLMAFRETRSGGLSVDVFWDSQSQTKQVRRKTLIDAAMTCSIENHGIVGWSTFTVKDVAKYAADFVRGVFHSPTPTNGNHADLKAREFMKISGDSDADRNQKANIFAKLLYDFALSHGKVELPPPPHVTAPEARL